MKFRLLFLFMFTYSIQAAGIRLNSGEYFVGTITGETADSIQVSYEGEEFTIPLSAIHKIERHKITPVIVHSFQLADGSSVKGVVAREDASAFTVETKAGFEIVKKDLIKSQSHAPEPMQAPPAKYRKARFSRASAIAVSVERYTILTGERYSHPTAYGISATYEPYFAIWPEYRAGISANYIEAPGDRTIGMAGSFLYGSYYPRFLKNCYGTIGLGAMAVAYKGRAGVSPAALVSLGYIPFSRNDLDLRAGIKTIAVYEKWRPTTMAGLELGLVYRL